jgi:hypothetical protein
LASTPVDALAQKVGMTGVPRILLDHVDKHVPRGHGAITVRHLATQAVLPKGIEPLVRSGNLGLPGCEGVLDHARVRDRTRKVPIRSSSRWYGRGASVRPCSTRWNQWFSTWARWRTRPSKLKVLGGTERRASWLASSPSHFISMVSR